MVKVISNQSTVSVELKGSADVVISETVGAISALLANLHEQMITSVDEGACSYSTEQYVKEDIKCFLMQSYLGYMSEVNRKKQENDFETVQKHQNSEDQYFS